MKCAVGRRSPKQVIVVQPEKKWVLKPVVPIGHLQAILSAQPRPSRKPIAAVNLDKERAKKIVARYPTGHRSPQKFAWGDPLLKQTTVEERASV